MSAGVGFRSRVIDSVGALTPAQILEYSKLIDAGMVFKWDASGPAAAMQQAPLVNTLPEFAYLAIDLVPVQLFIKRSRPGVTPAIWDAGPKMPDFTLQQLLDSEAAATQSAQTAIAKAASANASASVAATSAALAVTAQTAAKASANAAAVSAATAVALVGVQLPAPIPVAMKSLLAAMMAMLPTSPPDGAGQPWLDNGVLSFTPSTPDANAAAIAAANAVNQNQLNPAQVVILMQGMAATLPTDLPDGSGQPWLNNGVLAFAP